MGKFQFFMTTLLLSGAFLADLAQAGEAKEKKVWTDFYKFCLEAEQNGRRARVLECRDRASKENGYEGWADFIRKAKKALGPEVWARVQHEAHTWYKAQPGAGGPRGGGFGGLAGEREAGAKGPREVAPPVDLKEWKPMVRAELVLRLGKPSEETKARYKDVDLVSETVNGIRDRLGGLEFKGFEVEKLDDGTIRVRLPSMEEEDLEGVKALILMRGNFRIRLVAEEGLTGKHRGKEAPENHEWLEYYEKEKAGEKELVMIDDGPNFGGEIIKTAYIATDGLGFPAVGFHIHKEAQDRFFEYTKKHAEEGGEGRRIALVLDGTILSAPVIRAGIKSGGIISAGAQGFDLVNQKNLIAILNSKPHAADLELVKENRR